MTHYQPINSDSERAKRIERDAAKKKEWQADTVDPNVDVMKVTRQLSEGMRR